MSKTLPLVTVVDLLYAAGHAPRLSFTGVADAAWLAEAVAYTVGDPLGRLEFRLRAARDIIASDAALVSGEHCKYLQQVASAVENIGPTPHGVTERWDSVIRVITA